MGTRSGAIRRLDVHPPTGMRCNMDGVNMDNGRGRLLTPEDIDRQSFRTTGLFNHGYDIGEVDDFLESVKLTISALGHEVLQYKNDVGQNTQTIRPEVTELTNQVHELSSQVESLEVRNRKLQEENDDLRNHEVVLPPRPINPITGMPRS